MNNMNKRIGKIGFLIVMIGFFMPISCDMNGFQIANFFFENGGALSGLLMYLLFISAIAGIVIGVLLMRDMEISSKFEWVTLIVCITSGFIVYLKEFGDAELQSGAYVILTGWIIALLFQLMSIKKEE